MIKNHKKIIKKYNPNNKNNKVIKKNIKLLNLNNSKSKNFNNNNNLNQNHHLVNHHKKNNKISFLMIVH